MITRRTALVGAWGIIGQVITGSSIFKQPPPMTLAIFLDQWKDFRFQYQGKEVVITPAEMFAALEQGK